MRKTHREADRLTQTERDGETGTEKHRDGEGEGGTRGKSDRRDFR